MKKILLLLCCVLLSWNASVSAGTREVGGVTLADMVHPGNHDLLLNGAGVRSKFIFDLYVAALYLDAKQTTAAAVLSDAGEKRLALHLLRDISAKTLSDSFNKAISNNHSAAELVTLDASLQAFAAIFSTMNEVKQGDVVTLDYLAGSDNNNATQVSVNGVVKGRVAGAEFNRALLKVWLGERPAQDDLKKKLLGGE